MVGCSCAARGLRIPTRVPSARVATRACPRSGSWGAKRETVHAFVEHSQGFYIVADDLQVVNGHLEIPLFIGV